MAHQRLLRKSLGKHQERFGANGAQLETDFSLGQVHVRRNGRPKKPNHGFEKGVAAERRFFGVCARKKGEGAFPSWLVGVRMSTTIEDSNGIDAVAETDIGIVPIQIKSSEAGRRLFRKKDKWRHIICIVVNQAATNDDIFNEMLSEVEYIWDNMRRARATSK